MPLIESIDINCDLGEGMNNDEQVMPFISSANIACGYHAGNEETMLNTLSLCRKYNVAPGAHPSFPDKKNFGRTPVQLAAGEIYKLVTAQLTALHIVAVSVGILIKHVKPHGALYNLSASDKQVAAAIAKAVFDFNPAYVLFGLSNSVSVTEAKAAGLKTMNEGFADRTYEDDGSLTPRNRSGALITDAGKAVQQVLQMVNEKTVTAISGKIIPIEADTVCIHGDGPCAAQLAKVLYNQFGKEPRDNE